MQSIDRLVNLFPSEHRRQILFQIANCLRGISCQMLIPRLDGKGRILASENLVTTEAVRKLIRNDQLLQLPSVIQTGSHYKMQLMEDAVRRLREQEIIA